MGEREEEMMIIAEIGAANTKAILLRAKGGSLQLEAVAEAPTTVEPPRLDVTKGIEAAVEHLEAESGERLWGDEGPKVKFLCSSGDAGGLHMVVAGVMGMISKESAERAALGAGAHLLDAFSKDDKRPDYVLVEAMRSNRPDIFLLAGGTDGGAVNQVLELATLIAKSDVRPRFGEGYKLPVIFAGNVEARKQVSETLREDRYATRAVANVRPDINRENLGPAKEAIYDSYMEHVIVHAPGYDKLTHMVKGQILPSQATVGKALYAYAESRDINLLAVDVGSATTDIYSVYNGVFNRSLNAEVGLTYGILNVLKIAGVDAVSRWLPYELNEKEVRNIAANLMALQPEKLTPEEEAVRDAAAREAIKLSVELHKRIASRLKGIVIKRTIADTFSQSLEETHVNMAKTQAIVARGKAFEGLEETSALILLDALEPIGVTQIMNDPELLVSHAGILLDYNKDAAVKLLSERILKPIGTCVCPKGKTESDGALTIKLQRSMGLAATETIPSGEIKAIPLKAGEMAELEATPSGRLDLGRGRGKTVKSVVTGGSLGLIIDARGRPLPPPKRDQQRKWLLALAAGKGGA